MISKSIPLENRPKLVQTQTKPRVGEVRRFGKFGPIYVIQKIKGESCSVEVPENGQKASLLLSQVISDPLES